MNRLKRLQNGVSIVEVVIVFAVVSIMMTATMPAFHDHAIRAKVTVGLSKADEAMAALERTCQRDQEAIVSDNLDAGFFYIPSGTEADYLDRIMLGADCERDAMAVVMWTSHTGAATDPVIEWNADFSQTSDRWSCRVIAGDLNHVPAECRQRYMNFSMVVEKPGNSES